LTSVCFNSESNLETADGHVYRPYVRLWLDRGIGWFHGSEPLRVGCALVTIESFDNLPTAKRYMHRIAVRVPGSYVVFSQASRRVLAKVVHHADA
jgi:hypothetical protein